MCRVVPAPMLTTPSPVSTSKTALVVMVRVTPSVVKDTIATRVRARAASARKGVRPDQRRPEPTDGERPADGRPELDQRAHGNEDRGTRACS